MPNMPELPITLDDATEVQVEGEVYQQPIYQTHRGKNPEGHDKQPVIQDPPQGFLRYREVES